MATFKINGNENGSYTSKTFRLPTNVVRRLEVLADINNISVNRLVTQCCEFALNNLELSEEQHSEYIKRTSVLD